MKRQLLAAGLCATSLISLATAILPAYALRTITLFETEGRSKFIGTAQHDSHYILRGAFGGPSNDSSDSFIFDVREAGSYTFFFSASDTSQPLRNARLSLTTYATFSPGRGIASTGPNKALAIFLPRGRYQTLLGGQSGLSAGQSLRHQTHLLTPR